MKRSWKNFRLDKNKVYMRLGQAAVYSSLYIVTLLFCYWMCLQGMTYQEGKMTKKREKELRKLVYQNDNITTLLQDGLKKVVNGDTSFEEILKIIDINEDYVGEAEDNIKDALIGKITPKEKDVEVLEF